jgi:NtrC-family two-component system sensor histidine kinase KinB
VLRGPTFAVPRHGGEQHYQLTVSPILAINEFTLMQESAGHILCLRNVSDFKKLDQVKSQFLATISHELKTPLSSIKLSLMLLQNERTGAEERQRLAAGIRDETQRLLDMVGQLIDVSRLDAGAGIKLNPQAVHLADVVQYALDTVAPQLQDKQLQVDVQVADTLPAVQGDLEKTTWVLINLLSNAVRYSPPGAPLIIRGGLWGEMVRLSVQDHGPGIPPQYHKRIFERFAGVPNSAAHAGSSGLGLHISHEFIVAQGGQLWVESKPDCGSCFIFTLPVVVEIAVA